MQPRLKRQRPLARACPQLLLDLAALLEGLRPLIMLDHAAGVTPAQLLQALQPLPQLLPDFYGEPKFWLCIAVRTECYTAAPMCMLDGP